METVETLKKIIIKYDVENFFFHEANLLDTRQFTQWLDLLHDGIHYWAPMLRNVKFGEHREMEETRSGSDIHWMDEGKVTLRQRVDQIMTGLHYAEEPLSRTSHILTNLEIVDVVGSLDVPEAVETRSRFLIYRNRLQTETDILVGKREDSLIRNGSGWLIKSRKIILDQNVMLPKNITFFF